MATLDQIKTLFQTNAETMTAGFAKLEKDMQEFKEEIITSVADAIKPTNEKMEILEAKLKEKDEEIGSLRRDLEFTKRKNNLILFGVKENEMPEALETVVLNLVRTVTDIKLSSDDIDDAFRLGKKTNGKCRPVLLSLVSNKKTRLILSMKHLFKQAKIVVTQDLPKEVLEEKKRLQPMITALNREGTKASFRMGLVILNGEKLSKEEIEEQMNKFNSTKRLRSPGDDDTSSIQRLPCPKRVIKTTTAQRSTEVNMSPPSTGALSPVLFAPSRMFPVFSQTAKRSGVLSPLPGGSNHSKTFELHSER